MSLEKEVLIYQNIPYKKYRWISYISIIQVCFLSINLFAFPSAKLAREHQDNTHKRKEKKDSEFSENIELDLLEKESNIDSSVPTYERLKGLNFAGMLKFKNLTENIAEQPYLSAGLIGASALVVTGLSIYASRMIHKITLLPRDHVRISFFSPLAIGRPPSIEIPLQNVSCASPRQTDHTNAILKLKGYRGYHLVNKKEGEFIEPQLYDNYLGYERSWAKQ